MSEATRLEEASKHIKSAQKKLKRGLTKWSIGANDYDVAALEYESAAKIYQYLKKHKTAIETWETAAAHHEKADNYYCQGRCFESIAIIHKDQKNQTEQINAILSAGKAYLEDGKPDKGADAYIRAAKVSRDIDSPVKAAEYVTQALTILDDEELYHLTPEPARLLISLRVKSGDYQKAVEAIKRSAGFFKQLKQSHNIDKGAVEIVILRLAAKDPVLAERDLHSMSETFGIDGEEAITAQDLVRAYQEADEEQFNSVLGRQVLTFLHPDIARLSKKVVSYFRKNLVGERAGYKIGYAFRGKTPQNF
eukprot:TRINITY_DN9930_c0_g1_i1.p1 TRINITY_DN9930_c0_g1~~TRINITY_DN9930_c0_g1_i1.p1  ORF type:complete len:307 (+),score=56.96 TRINITY_DN9930_c0_g1_i1:65-985(+)